MIFKTLFLLFAQIKIWRSDTNWNNVRNIISNAFRKSQEDRVIIVHIIWGLQEQDRDECHHTDFKCKGKTVLDLDFDLNLNDCQRAVLVSFIGIFIGK